MSQTMINVANRYITEHGLQFNPKKTDCVIFGRSTLQPHPEWELNGTKLSETDSVTYLGVTLSYVKPNMHVDNRISACRRAYYAMQGAGLCNNITDADAIAYLWNAAIRPVLTYGINCIHVSKTCLARMETLQAKLLKAGIGVHKWSRSSPILKALNIKKIETTIDISSLDLGRSILCNGSRARSFYIYLMNMHACGQLNGHNYLVSRISKTCDKHNVSFLKYVFNENYASHARKNMLRMSHDGLSDSVRQCIISHDPYDRVLLRMLLKAF